MAHFTSYKLLAVAWWVLLLGLATGCVSPYLPAVPAASQDNLVVNGFINSQGITTIQLTRSLALQATEAPRAETRATVAVVAANGQRFALAEGAAGTYASASQRLSPTMTYKLTIATAGGKTYETDLLPVKVAPAIDQVHWRYEKEGVQLYVDTHDAARNTTYYRWTFQETWQFTSAFESKFRYNPTTKLVEPRRDDIYHCWRTVNSTTVLQNSTARLSQDAVIDFPLIFIPATSEKLPTRYSILVQQFAQTKEEYDYWETLKKTTGSSGTLNDPLPTQLTGNIRCVSDPSEPVLGYVGVHAVSEQRLFIDRSELPMPFGFVFTTGNEGCLLIAENRCPTRPAIQPPPPRVTFVFNNPQYLITNADCDTLCYPTACHYYGAAAACVDCRLRGTNVKPSFWK